MGWKEVLADSVLSSLRHPGDSGATLREFRARQSARREKDLQLLAQHFANVALQAFNEFRAARRNELGTGPWHTQSVDADTRVEVKNGFSWDQAGATTEILINVRDGSGDRYHIVIDEYGNMILNEFHPGSKRK